MKDMQKMNTRTGLLGISVAAAGLLAAACGEKSETNPPIVPTPPVTVTPSVTPSVTTPPVTPTTPAVTPPVTPTTGTTDTGATTTTPATPMSACTSVDYAADNNTIATADFPGVAAYYGYGDGKTSLCSGAATAAAMLCVEGNAVSSKAEDDSNDYLYYGAGVGLQMVVATDGVAEAPWNATALGITGLKFTASQLAGRHVRVQFSQVDETGFEYQQNSFVWGGTKYASKELKPGGDGDFTINLADVALPEWSATALTLDKDTAIDPTKIYAVAFQIANNPSDDTELYSFCISNLQWVDANGATVAVVAPDPGGTGDTGGSDTTAVDTGSGGSDTASVSSGGSDTSAPATSGGEDTGGGTEVYAIFQAKCAAGGTCHGDTGAQTNKYGSATLATSQAAADGNKSMVATRVAAGTMPPAGAPALTPEEKTAVADWAAAQ